MHIYQILALHLWRNDCELHTWHRWYRKMETDYYWPFLLEPLARFDWDRSFGGYV